MLTKCNDKNNNNIAHDFWPPHGSHYKVNIVLYTWQQQHIAYKHSGLILVRSVLINIPYPFVSILYSAYMPWHTHHIHLSLGIQSNKLYMINLKLKIRKCYHNFRVLSKNQKMIVFKPNLFLQYTIFKKSTSKHLF